MVESNMNGNDSDSGDEAAFLQSLGLKQNLRKGKEVAAKAASSSKGKDKSATTGGGSFQSMALKPDLLRALLHRGFTTPTPIQRVALPAALTGRDIVGMARTGSGKTLAYMVPLIQRLGALHSPKYGARALVLVPTRELALQVLKVGKDLARGAIKRPHHSKAKEESSSSAATFGDTSTEQLRWGLIVGGDSLDEQYNLMAANPDVIIATPGRLLHLLVEMNSSLRSVEFLVFDEADRLFELGFETSLTEIISKLAPSRQTLLFSATLPKSLVEFAKAGLQNPKLVRLDAESKISNDLQMAFISVKPKEKEAALLLLLRDVIKTPQASELPTYGEPLTDDEDEDERRRKSRDTMHGRDTPNRRGGRGGASSSRGGGRVGLKAQGDSWKDHKKKKHAAGGASEEDLLASQSIVFAATKHHVEYLSLLLVDAGYSVSSVYGSMDQSARRSQLGRFRSGKTSIMVVTDLAARGIDIPLLPNVVNYDFPASARTFVHRVGRTARAGRKGWAYSFVTSSELPHLFDLQLFLGRPLVTAPTDVEDFANNLVLGTMPRERLDLDNDHFRSNMLEDSSTLAALLAVADKGQKMYERSQPKASQESYRRAKELASSAKGLAGSEREEEGVHPVFAELQASMSNLGTSASMKLKSNASAETSRTDLLAQINAFRPPETVLEIGHRGKTVAAQIMQKRRVSLGKARARLVQKEKEKGENDNEEAGEAEVDGEDSMVVDGEAGELADEDDLASAFEDGSSKKQKKDYRDPSIYMGYVQEGAEAERGYSLTGGDNFASQAASTTYDMNVNDELGAKMAPQKASMLRWDRKHKKFVKGDGTGSDNKKLIRTESGGKLPASFKSGSFDDWKKKQKVYLPKIGEAELKGRQLPNRAAGPGGQRYRHNAIEGARDPNAKPKRDGRGGFIKDDKRKKPGFGSKDAGGDDRAGGKTRSSTSEKVRQSKGSGAQLKSVDQIRKDRLLKEKRVKRSTMPSKKGKGKRK